MFVSSFIQELRTREKSSISFFVSGVNQANGGGQVSSRFPCITQGVKRFFKNFSRAVKKYTECTLELGCEG